MPAMPHYRIDPEVAAEYAEMAGQEVPDDFQPNYYESAEATLDFGRADANCRRVRDALLAAGFHAVTCTYDGGYDEGFAHFGTAHGADGDCGGAGLIDRLGDTTALLASDPTAPDDAPESYRVEVAKQWAPKVPAARLGDVLYAFAESLATRLLGGGYGTGELALRGRFRCDLNTGEIVDIEPDPPESEYF